MDFRLPRNVEPIHYKLHLIPDFARFTFYGSEAVEIRVLAATKSIVLNSAELKVSSALVRSKSGSAIEARVRYDEELEQLWLSFDQVINPGTWTVEIEFRGVLTDKLRGFYRSNFVDPKGVEQVIATTQFEATDARRAFPCWDEPDLKATFEISLDIPDDLLAVSNSKPVSRKKLDGGLVRVQFARTIKMSTYLVAFVVGPLKRTKTVNVDGVELAIVFPPGKEKMVEFALEIGEHALRFFSNWFSIEYPSDKLDLIAIPDFAFGAMENLGAVTFRETALLVDPGSASRVDYERVADVVAHEIAHMWFGDLVTMKWWNGIWLNEAFATFAEMSCVDAFRPNWDRWVTFGLTRSGAMTTDELSSTRPIEFPVVRPEEAQGMFDVLTYEKGAGVLRMLECYLGSEVFLSGIKKYLNDHLYSNAETTDLWDAIEEASSQPVRQLMDSWIFQGGHPCLSAKVESNQEGYRLLLSQSPFRLARHRTGQEGDAIGLDWQIPVQVRVVTDQSEESFKVIVDRDGSAIELVGEPDLVIINSGGTGFYRSQYLGDLNSKLSASLEHLDPNETFNLVTDNWALALSGLATMGDYFSVVSRLSSKDPNVWTNLTNSLSFLDLVANYSPCREQIRQSLAGFVQDKYLDQLDRISNLPQPGEDEKIGTLRAVIYRALGTVGNHSQTIEWAHESFNRYLKNVKSLPADLVSAVVTIVSASDSSEIYSQVLDRYRNPISPQDEVRFLVALCNFEDPDLYRSTLEMVFREVRSQNAPFVIMSALSNRERADDGWSFVKANWDKLNKILPDQMVCRALETVSNLCSDDLAKDVLEFFSSHTLKTGQRTLDQSLEKLEVNRDFVQHTLELVPEAIESSRAK